MELMSTDLCGESRPSTALSAEALEAEFKPPTSLDLAWRAFRYYSECTLLLLSYVPVFLKTKFQDDDHAPGSQALEDEWSKLHENGARRLSALVAELQGFYVKVGQVIATRSDLFPAEYSRELAYLVDSVNPFPFPVVKRVVEQELLGGLPMEDVFESFDPVPLGSASIAQVHRATLKGGKEVAVKVQRPNVELRLMSDLRVVKNFSLVTREIFPVDYYLVCKELEDQIQDEFDFIAEASGMDQIAHALERGFRRPAVTVPRSIPGLSSRRVLCMEFVPGAPLSQLQAELKRRGIEIEPGSKIEQAFGRKLLRSLTEAFGVMVFEEGFFHADPHPGNIFIQPDSSVALIDFGQTKRINYKFRRQVAELMVKISDYNHRLESQHKSQDDLDEALDAMGNFAKSMGVEFLPSAKPSCAGALALWLFESSRRELPGGYEANELSPNCPVRDVASFPREFVLLCRMTLLIRGLAMRLNVEWSLADAWREAAMRLLERESAAAEAKPAADTFKALARPLRWCRRIIRPQP